MAGKKVITFDSWNGLFWIGERIIGADYAKKLAKTGKYHFQEVGYRGDLGSSTSKLYPPSKSYEQVLNWI